MAADPYQNPQPEIDLDHKRVYQQRHPNEITGHPEIYLLVDNQPTLITVCAQCGELRTILFLNKDRWFCYRCKTEGASPPNLYPVA